MTSSAAANGRLPTRWRPRAEAQGPKLVPVPIPSSSFCFSWLDLLLSASLFETGITSLYVSPLMP